MLESKIFFISKCEHPINVKASIFEHRPYLNPSEKYTLADKDGTVANYIKQNNLTYEQYEEVVKGTDFTVNNRNQSKTPSRMNDSRNQQFNDGKNSKKDIPRTKENSNALKNNKNQKITTRATKANDITKDDKKGGCCTIS